MRKIRLLLLFTLAIFISPLCKGLAQDDPKKSTDISPRQVAKAEKIIKNIADKLLDKTIKDIKNDEWQKGRKSFNFVS
ncbi:hypothetical protein ACFLYA_02280 [Candidatus Dependentiae bacterium]